MTPSASPDIVFHERIFSDRSWGIFLAVAVHAAFFIAGTAGWMKQAEYGMDLSFGQDEVDLIAAPAPMNGAFEAPPTAAVETPAPPADAPEDVPEPTQATQTPVSTPVLPAVRPILQTDQTNGPLGDGSSPVAGTDATTVHRAGSSGSYFKPGYYRNPPPAYPDEARKLKQQGRVLLQIDVTAEGKVSAVRMLQSSGFPLLDEAALKGVQNWRFRPATMAGLRLATQVEVPIRFQLK